jgi:hypothetical protein
MADVTISSLPLGTPSGSGLIPYSQENQTLATPVSAIFESFYYPPNYDSGWFRMSSQAGNASYKELTHNLNQYPTHVKVLTKAIDGNNQGFIFEGMGAAQSDDDGANYGGIIFAYNASKIRLWAPTINNNTSSGYIINVTDGWGNENNNQYSHTADVRVLAWKGFFNLV